MIRYLCVTALLLSSLPAYATGPTEHRSLRKSPAYESDEKWWKCSATLEVRGCVAGPLAALGLTAEEQNYVRGTLDHIPWMPSKLKPDELQKRLGGKPIVVLDSKFSFTGVGPGVDLRRDVSIYVYEGSAFMIHWFQPNRFMLIKARSF